MARENRPSRRRCIPWAVVFSIFTAHALLVLLPRVIHPPIPCILIHHVGPPASRSDLWAISDELFLSFLDALAGEGYRTLSLEEVARAVETGEMPSDPPYVLITFDDGCRSHLDVVLPELRRRKWTAVFFVTRPRENDRRFLDSDGIRRLAAEMEVQSHTRTFKSLLKAEHESEADYEKRLRLDLAAFKDELRRLTGGPVYALAYPSGEFDDRVADEAGSAYRLCFTTEYGTIGPFEDRLRLPRYMLTAGCSTTDPLTFVHDDGDWYLAALLLEILVSLASLHLFVKTLA